MTTSVHIKVHLVSFVVQGQFFSAKLSGFTNGAIKLLMTESVGQCRNILPSDFSALTSFGRPIRKRLSVISSCTDLPLS